MTASCASRDITVQKALDVLHENNYDIGRALLNLTPNNIPTICKDELEEWSPAEAALFEESLDKYSKSFYEIRKEVMPWKKMKSIVEYYYMWKTTDRYVNQKKLKANESESKLKQVYIPNVKENKQMNNGIGNIMPGDTPGKYCESCGKTQSSLWFSYGAPHTNNRLCNSCWNYFKKFGGLRYPDRSTIQNEQDKPQQNSTTDNGQTTVQSNNAFTNLINTSSSLTSGKESNNLTNNSSNNNSTNDENEFKCKDCNKTFNRQGNDAHVVLNLMVKNRKNDEGDDFDLCNNCLSSKSVSF